MGVDRVRGDVERVRDLPVDGPVRPGLREDLGAGLAALRREPDVLVLIATLVPALAAASGFLTVGVIALVAASSAATPASTAC